MYHLDLKGLCSHIYLVWDNTGGGSQRLIGNELCILFNRFQSLAKRGDAAHDI